MTASIELQAMSETDFQAWLPATTERYAEDKVRAGNWPGGGALERSRKELAALLPQGRQTPEHLFFNVVDSTDKAIVGNLWVKTATPVLGGTTVIYNIEVNEERRGRGYGTATLAALEQRMRAQGAVRLALHVFGFNQSAQRLYQRMGYEVTNVAMSKPLLPPS